ncbi:hypothetical protein [Halioxenophilus sp. WMMB6]|uniref:hypothetical protein n=1 Tax=Halioxenophilus sp. WMMB6 TaxID=3073815 RepID=UPI00295ECEB6|nr:hypothetical protein [Halioxenophilus sp. WMMB6]
MLPSDLSSFIWGLVSGIVVVVFSSFFSAAGGDLWRWVKAKVSPSPPPPLQVRADFKPRDRIFDECAWVHGQRTTLRELEGYRFYLHPKTRARCFRELQFEGEEPFQEWLMLKPDTDPPH